MQIKDMFRKKIDREIQGVIIVGQGEETKDYEPDHVHGLYSVGCR